MARAYEVEDSTNNVWRGIFKTMREAFEHGSKLSKDESIDVRIKVWPQYMEDGMPYYINLEDVKAIDLIE